MPARKLLDIGSWITIGVTFVLFVVSLFVEGIPHDLLLEAGVFLVSVKLVIMTYKNSMSADEVKAELRALRQAVEHRQES